jgi:hypothetical protein
LLPFVSVVVLIKVAIHVVVIELIQHRIRVLLLKVFIARTVVLVRTCQHTRGLLCKRLRLETLKL